jgi:hypothetical protein
MSNEEPIREIPAEVQARLTSWKRGRQIMGTTAHNLLGLLGILGSLVALAGLPGIWTKGATIVTGFAIAAMTLWNPRREYMKFGRAWRVLEDAARRYSYGLIPLSELFDAIVVGEGLIEEADALSGDSSVEMLRSSLDHGKAAIAPGSAAPRQRKATKRRTRNAASATLPPPAARDE